MDNPKWGDFTINKSLPQSVFPGPNLTSKEEQTEHITKFLNQTLPPTEANTIKQELPWHFTLEKHSVVQQQQKQQQKHQQQGKKKYRKRNKRSRFAEMQPRSVPVVKNDTELCHELEEPETGWDFNLLLPIRAMWRRYIKRCVGKPVAHLKNESSSLRVILGKCEFIGADIKVEKSTDPSLVGKRGIVVKETKDMFAVVTGRSLCIKVPKNTSVFMFHVGNMRLTVYGKHLMTRPAERSVKKIKSMFFIDL